MQRTRDNEGLCWLLFACSGGKKGFCEMAIFWTRGVIFAGHWIIVCENELKWLMPNIRTLKTIDGQLLKKLCLSEKVDWSETNSYKRALKTKAVSIVVSWRLWDFALVLDPTRKKFNSETVDLVMIYTRPNPDCLSLRVVPFWNERKILCKFS